MYNLIPNTYKLNTRELNSYILFYISVIEVLKTTLQNINNISGIVFIGNK